MSDRNRHRRLRDYYLAVNEYGELSDAIFAVSPSLTATDTETILEDLAAHLDDYGGSDRRGRETFTRWALAWVKLRAGLIVKTRDLAPKLIEAAAAAVPGLSADQYSVAAGRVALNRSAELMRDDTPDDVLGWASEWVVLEARGLAAWSEWVQSDMLRRCVYKGLWRVLCQCADLGLGESDVESLSSDVWLWAHENAADLAQGPVPVGARLRERAYWLGKQWRLGRTRAKKRFVTLKSAAAQERRAENSKRHGDPVVFLTTPYRPEAVAV